MVPVRLPPSKSSSFRFLNRQACCGTEPVMCSSVMWMLVTMPYPGSVASSAAAETQRSSRFADSRDVCCSCFGCAALHTDEQGSAER